MVEAENHYWRRVRLPAHLAQRAHKKNLDDLLTNLEQINHELQPIRDSERDIYAVVGLRMPADGSVTTVIRVFLMLYLCLKLTATQAWA